ncbi:MAG: CoA transferase [Gammaproteobacteria bacterium]|nr:CoA transferase [Gammaproteobacteria bacterium]
MHGPLHGIRIIDFTTMIAGPYATMILADQGADVIKIEAPERSDHVRRAGYAQREFSAAFLNNNRNKRSLCLDVKSKAGRELLLRLVATADVFVQNFRPGIMQRLGIDYDQLRVVNPELIYVSVSGWGESGPYAHKPVYDPIIQALSGLASVQGGSDELRPRLVRTIVPDKVTGITAAQAVSAALFAREITGEGQHVKLSMLDSVVAFLWSSDMGSQTFVGQEVNVARAATFIDLIYETAAGYISVSVMSDDQWQGLAHAVGHPEWLDDERFKTPAGRDHFANERLELTQTALMTRAAAEWLDILDSAGVPCAPVLTRSQMVQHPQVQSTGIIVETEHPHAGRLRQARNAARFEGTPTEHRFGAPELGEHTLQLLTELGLDAAEAKRLLEAGIISTSTHHQEDETSNG